MSDQTQHVPDGPLPASPTASGAPQTFGRYRATGTLGAGAMGTVYRAHDEMLGRDVAIKSLTASGELGIRERFLREARAIGAVHHPNILAVHDVGEEGSTPYLVMELAAGGSLRDRIKAGASPAGAGADVSKIGAIPVDTVREVGIAVARALAAAHAAGIVHRDVKPGNILLATPLGHAPLWKLADFGIAHVPDSTLTMTGQFLGSPSYAAPESLREGKFGPASDVYSLGATLYEAVAGVPPHGDHDMQSLIRKLEQDPPPLATRVPSVPPALAATIMSALARDPASRPSAEQLAERLAARDDGAVVPAPAPVPVAARGSSNLSMKLIGVGLAAIVILAIVLAARGGSSSTSSAASPSPFPTPAAQPAEAPGSEESEDPEQKPMVVDQYGNPVDDETARQILEQMEQDAREASGPPGHGRGHKKKKDD